MVANQMRPNQAEFISDAMLGPKKGWPDGVKFTVAIPRNDGVAESSIVAGELPRLRQARKFSGVQIPDVTNPNSIPLASSGDLLTIKTGLESISLFDLVNESSQWIGMVGSYANTQAHETNVSYDVSFGASKANFTAINETKTPFGESELVMNGGESITVIED